MPGPRVAIACQGGGSHTAFTAGALSRLLALPREAEFVGLSGTSGGAICALLAWNALVTEREPGPGLRAFWRDVAATDPWDRTANAAIVGALRFWGQWMAPELSPYDVPPPLRSNSLPALLEAHVEPDHLPARVDDPGNPLLLVSAVNVRSGDFVTFRGGGPLPQTAAVWRRVTLEAILASAAVPTVFRAIEIDGDHLWDGLYAQNPPMRELLEAEPDELWVLQINPRARGAEPRRAADIRDRRNELAGNLSMEQEIHFIEKINELLAEGMLSEAGQRRYRHVEVRRIEIGPEMAGRLDYESKLDRDPELIEALLEDGAGQAGAFLAERAASAARAGAAAG